MTKLIFALPCTYFLKTRLNTKAAILFHGYAEYVLGILILVYFEINPATAVKNYVLSYIAFISIYEIGYIFNDFVSVRFEKSPRKRLAQINPSNAIVIFWIIIRVISFLLISYYLGALSSSTWIIFYLMLVFVFLLHNILKRKEYKIFTFCGLAFMRFYAPVFLFLPVPYMLVTLPGIFIHYIFFRTLTYADSKDLLNMENRNSLSFKCAFYGLFLPLSVVIAYLSANWLTILINLYFLLFWGSLLLLKKLHFIQLSELKTD